MNPDPFDDWLKQTAEKNRSDNIPQKILERLPKKVLVRVHEERRHFQVMLFCLVSALVFGAIAVTAFLKFSPALTPAPTLLSTEIQDPTLSQGSVGEEDREEEIVTVLVNLEEERLWQLGPDIYSANLEALDWVVTVR